MWMTPGVDDRWNQGSFQLFAGGLADFCALLRQEVLHQGLVSCCAQEQIGGTGQGSPAWNTYALLSVSNLFWIYCYSFESIKWNVCGIQSPVWDWKNNMVPSVTLCHTQVLGRTRLKIGHPRYMISIPVQVFSGKSGGSTHQKHVRFPKGAIFRKSLHTERMLFSKGHMWGMFGTYTRWAHAILWFALSWTLDSSFGSRFLGACDFLDDSLKACWIVLPKQGGLCTLIFPECWGVQICAVCDFLRRKT